MDATGVKLELLDHTLDIVVVLDEQGRFKYANAALERVLGYDPAAVTRLNAFEHIHPDDRERVTERFVDLVDASGAAAEAEFRFRAADGSWVWLAARMSSERATGLDGYVVSCRDISSRRAAEEQQRRAREKLLRIAEHTTDVLWMFSGDWEECLFVNSAYEDVWGRSVEALRDDPSDFLAGAHPADRDRIRSAMARLSAGESVDIEYRVDPTTGYRTWVWVRGHPITDEDGVVTRVVGFARDVSDRHERERQLIVMDRLLRHNLRNELNLIMGHAEQALDRAGDAVHDDVERILETGNRLLRTADKERDIVALLTEANDPKPLELPPAFEDVCARARSTYPEATIETTMPSSATAWAVPKLPLAVYELLTNAVEHADTEAPQVRLTVRTDAERVEIAVRDECPPIPVQEIRVLRGERDVRSVYHGSGLGLWVVHWAVDRSDGELWFDSDDRGNTVTISLPPSGVGSDADRPDSRR
jgi:PAS domain S-box-containing protein